MENKNLKKCVSNFHGKILYLIGKKNGRKLWLEKGSWDCGWYWGFGYISSFSNPNPTKAKDYDFFTHWDSMVSESKENAFDMVRHTFDSCTMSDDELWQFCDLMHSFYTAREYAEMLYNGNSHYTEKVHTDDIIKNDDELKRINEKMIPALMEKIYALLTPAEKVAE